MNKLLRIILLLVIVLIGCSEVPPEKRFIIVVFDQTGSMIAEDLEAGKEFVIEQILPILRKGDLIGIAAVTSSSYGYRYGVEFLPVSQQYLDMKNDSAVEVKRNNFIQLVRGISIVREYPSTDVYGMLASVSQVFLEDTLSNKYLIVISDMDDNVNREGIMSDVFLKDVHVYVLFASHKFRGIKDDFLAFKEKQRYWVDLFHEAGAVNSFFWDANLSKMKMDWLAKKLE